MAPDLKEGGGHIFFKSYDISLKTSPPHMLLAAPIHVDEQVQ